MELYNLILRGKVTLWLTPSGLHFYHSRLIQMPKYIHCFQCISAATFARSKSDSESSYVQHWQVSFSWVEFSSVQSLSCVRLFTTPWTTACQASLSITNSRDLLTQTHVHWVSDAIQPSHPLLSPSPPAFNISQHQGLFKWVIFSYQVAKILEFQLQHQSLQWTLRTDLL